MQTGKFKDIACRAAFRAGKYILGRVGKVKSVRYKGEINVVTDIDRKAEDIVVSTIKKDYPGHDFLAEEKKYARKNSDFTWIIDPLDGTTNFLHGFPVYCVSVALAERGKVTAGAVYDPTRDEMFCAERGKGAFLNRKRIRVSGVRALKKSLLATGFAYNIRTAKKGNVENFWQFLKASQAVRRAGSAAIDLCYVACGRFDGFWELRLHPWDTAAGLLLVEEAGGKISKFNGSPYTVYDSEMLASNAKIHSHMIKILS